MRRRRRSRPTGLLASEHTSFAQMPRQKTTTAKADVVRVKSGLQQYQIPSWGMESVIGVGREERERRVFAIVINNGVAKKEGGRRRNWRRERLN